MNKTFALGLSFFLAAIGLAVPAPAKDAAVASVWATGPLTIDGFDSEWSGTPLVAAEDHMAEFALRNDGANLYILFAIKDPKFLTNIGQTGLNVYFGADGKKSKNHGLRLVRRAVPADVYIASLEKSGKTLSAEDKAALKVKPFYVIFHCDVIGYKPGKDEPAPTTDPVVVPVYAAIGAQNFVVYECRIPLSREAHPGGLGVAAGDHVKIGFEWGGSAGGKGSMGGPRNPGLGDTTSETPESEHDSYSEGSGVDELQVRKKSPKKYSFWVDAKLAAQQ